MQGVLECIGDLRDEALSPPGVAVARSGTLTGMLEEIIVAVDDRPGVLAEVGELLGRSQVNIETLSAFSHQGMARIHLIVDDGEEAGEVLTSNGFKVETMRAVITATLDDRPGALGSYCRRLAEAGVTISGAYLARREAGESELIFAVDDLETAKSVSE